MVIMSALRVSGAHCAFSRQKEMQEKCANVFMGTWGGIPISFFDATGERVKNRPFAWSFYGGSALFIFCFFRISPSKSDNIFS